MNKKAIFVTAVLGGAFVVTVAGAASNLHRGDDQVGQLASGLETKSEGHTLLHEYILRGDIEKVAEVLKIDPTVNLEDLVALNQISDRFRDTEGGISEEILKLICHSLNQDQMTSLFEASINNLEFKVMEVILMIDDLSRFNEFGFELSMTDLNKVLNILRAAESVKEKNMDSLVKILEKDKSQDLSADYLIKIAEKLGQVDWILGHESESAGILPFYALKGNDDAVKVLLDRGANLYADDNSIIVAAFESDNYEIAFTLYQRAKNHLENVTNQDAKSWLLVMAVMTCDIETADSLLNSGIENPLAKIDSLQTAIRMNNVDMVSMLLRHGADADDQHVKQTIKDLSHPSQLPVNMHDFEDILLILSEKWTKESIRELIVSCRGHNTEVSRWLAGLLSLKISREQEHKW